MSAARNAEILFAGRKNQFISLLIDFQVFQKSHYFNQTPRLFKAMKINLAHLRDRSTSGGWINFAVFDADSTNHSSSARSHLLSQLTMKARVSGLRVDKAALAFMENGELNFFGTPDLVEYLSNNGISGWTHTLDV